MSFSAITRCEDTQVKEEDVLVAAARRGDVNAFSTLAANSRRKVLNKVRHIMSNLDDAEDVTQQALMKAFINIRTFRGMSSFSSWLTSIAINEALMMRRKPQTRFEAGWGHTSGEEGGIFPEFADIRPNPEQCFERKECYELVRAAIRTIRPTKRQCLEVCDLNENSLKHLASLQGSSLSAAKARLFRSRQLLRAKVNRYLVAGRPLNTPA